MTETIATTRLDSLTGVRFFAAFLVFGFHSVTYAKNGELNIFDAGMVGVSLFYILSGFVMSWTDRPGDTAWLFYRRRFARIYPAFIVAWLLSLAILIVGQNVQATDLVPPTLLQAWVPIEAIYFAGNAVFWSLSCEVFFYVTYPLFRRFVQRFSIRGLVLTAVAAGIVSLGAALLALPLPENEFTRWLLIIFPPLRLMEFVIGVCLGLIVKRGWRPRVPVWAASLLAVVGVVIAAIAPYSLSRYAVTLIPFVVLVVTLASSDLQGRGSVFRWRPVVALGVWSYGFYLLHAMIISVGFSVMTRFGIYGPETPAPLVWAELIGLLLVSIAAAWMLHLGVEAPLEKRLRPRRSGPRLDDDPSPAGTSSRA